MKVADDIINEGDYISIDGSTGEVMLGKVDTKEAEMSEDFRKLMKWADEKKKERNHNFDDHYSKSKSK